MIRWVCSLAYFDKKQLKVLELDEDPLAERDLSQLVKAPETFEPIFSIMGITKKRDQDHVIEKIHQLVEEQIPDVWA